MNVPEQVRRQAERANELLNQANVAPGEPQEAPTVTEPEGVQAVEPAAPADIAPAPAEPAPAPVPPVEPDWAHKYRTLQGVFNAEQARWNADRKTLEDRLKALESAQPAPAAQPQPQKLVTDKDVETYGPELMDVIRRQAAEMAQQIVAERMQQLQPVLDKTREQVTAVTQQVYASKEAEFYGELAKAVPDFAEVNADQKWLEWLGEIDGLSGVPRQVYLDRAQETLNHVQAANLFKAFKSTQAATAPAPAPAPAPARSAPSPSPRTVGQASAPAIREPQTGVRRSEIATHYRRSASDHSYRNSAAHKAMEARIADAMATGTILEE